MKRRKKVIDRARKARNIDNILNILLGDNYRQEGKLVMPKRNRWLGEPPKACQLCHVAIPACFVDGKTIANSAARGSWAIMCIRCHQRYGIGLGTGAGQQYERELVGTGSWAWVKVQG